MYVHLLCSAYMICITPSGSELGELVGEGVCERKMGGGGGGGGGERVYGKEMCYLIVTFINRYSLIFS